MEDLSVEELNMSTLEDHNDAIESHNDAIENILKMLVTLSNLFLSLNKENTLSLDIQENLLEASISSRESISSLTKLIVYCFIFNLMVTFMLGVYVIARLG